MSSRDVWWLLTRESKSHDTANEFKSTALRHVPITVDIKSSWNPLSLSQTRFYPNDYALL